MSSQRQFEGDNQQSVSQKDKIKNEQKQISNNNEQDQSRMEKKQQNHLDKKKKIIKKWQFGVNKEKFINSKGIIKMQSNNNKGMENKDDLRNWKPVNLQLGKKPVDDDNNRQNMHVKKQNIASSFLSMLPKPKQNNNDNDEMDLQNWRQKQMGLGQKRKKKHIYRLEQQEQQADQKWDGEKDEFMKQQPLRFQQDMQYRKQLLNIQDDKKISQNVIMEVKQGNFREQQDEQDQVVERIDWLDEKIREKKKQLSIADLVNRTWEKLQQSNRMNE